MGTSLSLSFICQFLRQIRVDHYPRLCKVAFLASQRIQLKYVLKVNSNRIELRQ